MATIAQSKDQLLPDEHYKRDALFLLKKSFPLLSVVAIQRTFHHNNELFGPSYNNLHELQVVVNDRSIKGVETKVRVILGLAPFLVGISPLVLKTKRIAGSSFEHEEKSQRLLRELEGIPEFQGKKTATATNNATTANLHRSEDKENIPINTANSSPIPAAAALASKTSGLVEQIEHKLTCECCYDDCSFDDMVSCSEGNHLFCGECVNEYIKDQLYGNNRTSFKCIGSVGCEGTFTDTMMKKVLAPKLLENAEKLAYREELLKSGMEIWTCPNCDFLGLFDDGGLSMERPGCKHKSCRLCKEAPHKNQSCEEAKLEKEKNDAHALLAETMTKAVIRSCPGCQASIVKSDGCNKMVCPNTYCKTKFCYLCSQKITGYDHFCRTPHCTHATCGKCILHSKAEADDVLRREAGLKQKAALGKAGEELELLSPEKQNPMIQPPVLARPDPILQVEGMAAFVPPPVPRPVLLRQQHIQAVDPGATQVGFAAEPRGDFTDRLRQIAAEFEELRNYEFRNEAERRREAARNERP